MPSDVRKMSDEELLDQYFDHGWQSTRDELSRRLGIMRTALKPSKHNAHLLGCICLDCEGYRQAQDAFRQMEAET